MLLAAALLRGGWRGLLAERGDEGGEEVRSLRRHDGGCGDAYDDGVVIWRVWSSGCAAGSVDRANWIKASRRCYCSRRFAPALSNDETGANSSRCCRYLLS